MFWFWKEKPLIQQITQFILKKGGGKVPHDFYLSLMRSNALKNPYGEDFYLFLTDWLVNASENDPFLREFISHFLPKIKKRFRVKKCPIVFSLDHETQGWTLIKDRCWELLKKDIITSLESKNPKEFKNGVIYLSKVIYTVLEE